MQEKFIKLTSPSIGKEEENAVLKVLRNGHLSQGEQVGFFEREFADYCGTKYAVAVANGTCALHLALMSCGIGIGDEVITSPFSFVATASAISHTGAKPVFADIENDTFNINPDEIERKISKKTKAILPVHLFGKPANILEILKIAKKHNLKVIEDACQAHGAKVNGIKVGSFGDTGCFSFYPTKNMTTGEGGMITTNSKETYEKLKLLRSHGMKKRYFHEILGFNYRMTDVNAAIGREQLKKLDGFNKRRIEIAGMYNLGLYKVEEISLPNIEKGVVFHQYSILVNQEIRNKLKIFLEKKGIATEIYYPLPIHMQKIYKKDDKFPVSEEVSKSILSLPIYPGLKDEEVNFICRNILEFFSKVSMRNKKR